MATPYLGEIKIMAFNFPPKGWALCNGQILPINQNQALFSLMGTMYGGNGVTTFALPNLQGRVPIHLASGFTQGQSGGQETHTLIISETPQHVHGLQVSSDAAATLQASPVGAFFGNAGASNYSTNGNASMATNVVGNTGGSQPHENRPPYLVLNFCVALQGVFPSRN